MRFWILLEFSAVLLHLTIIISRETTALWLIGRRRSSRSRTLAIIMILQTTMVVITTQITVTMPARAIVTMMARAMSCR